MLLDVQVDLHGARGYDVDDALNMQMSLLVSPLQGEVRFERCVWL